MWKAELQPVLSVCRMEMPLSRYWETSSLPLWARGRLRPKDLLDNNIFKLLMNYLTCLRYLPLLATHLKAYWLALARLSALAAVAHLLLAGLLAVAVHGWCMDGWPTGRLAGRPAGLLICQSSLDWPWNYWGS